MSVQINSAYLIVIWLNYHLFNDEDEDVGSQMFSLLLFVDLFVVSFLLIVFSGLGIVFRALLLIEFLHEMLTIMLERCGMIKFLMV